MLKIAKKILFISFITVSFCILFVNQPLLSASNTVHIIQLNDDTINPVTAEYIVESIDRAYEENAQCLIIKLDTPGGLLSSTRLIVKKMLTSKVPIVVFISPSGSRAGSAGVFITYASHVAAMAPSTNIGAAHPVQMGQGEKDRSSDWRELRELIEELQKDTNKKAKKKENEDKDEKLAPDESPMESKILQDTLAFIRAIAKQRGRNVEWAVESVAKSASITDEEALEKRVIEIIAKDDEALLEKLDGRVVMINDEEVTLSTKDIFIERIGMDTRQVFFNILANPNIAYFLMILGFYGLLYEITHPGLGVPGVLGAIFLILAFYSMQTLPTNYAGLALLILGLILLIAEAYTPTFGLLTLGGLVCLVLGSMLLFESVDPVMRVSIAAIATFAVTTMLFSLVLIRTLLKFRRKKAKGGAEGIIGEIGEAKTVLVPGKKGNVFVHGEIWRAITTEKINKGDKVVVKNLNGLTLVVAKHTKAAP